LWTQLPVTQHPGHILHPEYVTFEFLNFYSLPCINCRVAVWCSEVEFFTYFVLLWFEHLLLFTLCLYILITFITLSIYSSVYYIIYIFYVCIHDIIILHYILICSSIYFVINMMHLCIYLIYYMRYDFFEALIT